MYWPVGEAVTVSCTNGHVFGRITYQGGILATGILPERVTIMSRFAPDSVEYYYSFAIFIYSA